MRAMCELGGGGGGGVIEVKECLGGCSDFC